MFVILLAEAFSGCSLRCSEWVSSICTKAWSPTITNRRSLTALICSLSLRSEGSGICFLRACKLAKAQKGETNSARCSAAKRKKKKKKKKTRSRPDCPHPEFRATRGLPDSNPSGGRFHDHRLTLKKDFWLSSWDRVSPTIGWVGSRDDFICRSRPLRHPARGPVKVPRADDDRRGGAGLRVGRT